MITVTELLRSNGIDTWQNGPGRQYLICPRCSALRKRHNQKKRCLSLMIEDAERAYWKCHHCGWSGPEKGTNYGLDGRTRYEYPNGNYKVKSPRGFVWEHESVDCIIRSGAKGLENILYRIEEAREVGGLVAVVEGEKDAETLWKLGIPAVTSAHGAAKPGQKPKWNAEHSRQLQGLDIVVLNDNDEQGYAHANAIVECSVPFAKSIRRLDLKEWWPGGSMPAGADISDYMAEVGGREGCEEAIREMIRGAPLVGKTRPELPWLTPFHDDDPIPEIQWAVKDLIPIQTVSLLSGEGGAGKSISALHLCTAHALALTWLNWFPEPGPAWCIDAEDPSNIIHFRLDKIRQLYQTSFAEIFGGGLKIMSLVGQDSLMATIAKNNTIEPTQLYKNILEEAGDVKPRMITIASAANVFAGNENDRPQVRQFISLLERIAIAANGSILLISHPSLTGISSGSGLSGSTQWHNSVRSRMVLRTPKTNGDGEEPDTDLRELVFFKNQYGPASLKLTLKWKDGLFLPPPAPTTIEKAEREAIADHTFMTALARYVNAGRNVSESNRANLYGPKAFLDEPEAKQNNIKLHEFQDSMKRLFSAGKIRSEPYGRPSNQYHKIVPA